MAAVIVGGARRALNGADACGDAFAWWRDGNIWTIALVDGLGHGPEAAAAADLALVHVDCSRGLTPGAIIAAVGDAIQKTRGAALTIVQVDAAARTLSHAGVGNVRAGLFGATTQRLEGRPGIVGTASKPPADETLPWRDGDLLLLWSDGFPANLDLDRPSLRLKGNPEKLANRLVEQLSTRRDDAGLVCCLLEGIPA